MNYKSVMSLVPLVGQLVNCSAEDMSSALQEVGISTLFATLPLSLLPIMSGLVFKSPISLSQIIDNGELFVYSSALCGPLLYSLTKKYGNFRRPSQGNRRPFRISFSFPYGVYFTTMSVLICSISGWAFATLNNPNYRVNGIDTQLNVQGFLYLSEWFFVISTGLFFLVTVYKNSLELSGRQIMAQEVQEENFSAEWAVFSETNRQANIVRGAENLNNPQERGQGNGGGSVGDVEHQVD